MQSVSLELMEVVAAVLRRLSPGRPVEACSGSGSSMSHSSSSVGVVVGIMATSGVGMYGMMAASGVGMYGMMSASVCKGNASAGVLGAWEKRGCRWVKALLMAWEKREMAGGCWGRLLLESGWGGECGDGSVLAR